MYQIDVQNQIEVQMELPRTFALKSETIHLFKEITKLAILLDYRRPRMGFFLEINSDGHMTPTDGRWRWILNEL